jgi:hypothetical protein
VVSLQQRTVQAVDIRHYAITYSVVKTIAAFANSNGGCSSFRARIALERVDLC